jgi:hypothetical protein
VGQTIYDIHTQARPLLVRLAMISHAPAARMDAMPRTRGTPEHRRPPGEARPEAEQFRDRLEGAKTVAAALAILDELRTELAHSQRRAMAQGTTETAADLAERIVEDGAGWAVSDVSIACRCTGSFVRRSRLTFGRDPETGYTPPDADPMHVAEVLHDLGRSTRTIERLTGIPRSTLRYRLNLR